MNPADTRRVMLADLAWLVVAGIGAGCAASLTLVVGALGFALLA